ncbi:MAG: sarcosine oxidase subunit alpha family protein [Sphingomonadaceae bacterium]|nr:sarcosine oxidase subunit alpha family protein [Sphingomonadaceae bacterium]
MNRLQGYGLIDRTQTLRFTFDCKSYAGHPGDTLASALLANGVQLFGRSFKYHRPRGVLTAGSEEPNALVTLRSGPHAEPNSRATTIELFDGLEATSQNRWPSLGFDLMAINQWAAPLFVAGFYYKTFMWPAKAWEKLYEPLIRRAAGLGALSGLPDPDSYGRNHLFCDLLIIGGGPAGLAAGLTAARAGLRVALVDEDSRLGGRLLAGRHMIDGKPGLEWVDAVMTELQALPNVTLLSRTTLFGVYDGREYGALQRLTDHLPAGAASGPRQCLWKIVAKQACLASGAIERPLVCGGNDRPGVMMASAVSAYVNRYGVLPGKRTLVFTTSDSGWQTALDLIHAGHPPVAVVEAREAGPQAAMVRVMEAGVEVLLGSRVADVGGATVRWAEVVSGTGRRRIEVDCVAMAGGWNPAVGLGSNLGHRPIWSEALNSFVMGSDGPPGLFAAGAAAGDFSLAGALASGARAAQRAADALDRPMFKPSIPCADDEPHAARPLWHVPEACSKAFVDFQHDVTVSDVSLAAREGFTAIEHLKRYTTLGMATDQGKTGQLNAHGVLAEVLGKQISEAGTILSRPPYHPVAIGAFAGPHRDADFRPTRYTAGHAWAIEQGAVFVDTGQWKRAQWFVQPGETHWRQSVDREVCAVRNAIGLCDVSTLGKIDVMGPDAGVLLDRLYINTFSALPVGKARYGVMLREDGMVMDDGTTTRLAEDHFYVTTTTANAALVMQHIDFARQVLWPELDVQATSVTEQWSTYALAGPRSRELVQRVFPAVDLSNEGVPFMGAVEARWQGEVARIFRLSFSGELAYELSVPAQVGDIFVRAIAEEGRPLGLTPYGTEALGVLRIEKGHPAGNELNGITTATDLGMGRMMSKKKDYIGRVMADRQGLTDPARPVLVGLRPANGHDPIRAGAHLLTKGMTGIAAHDQGYVTSAAFSPTLGHPIALALLAHGPERHGEEIVVHDPVREGDVLAVVCDPVFVDPLGVRVRG